MQIRKQENVLQPTNKSKEHLFKIAELIPIGNWNTKKRSVIWPHVIQNLGGPKGIVPYIS